MTPRDPFCLEGRPGRRCVVIGVVEAGFRFGSSSEGRRYSGILPLQAGLLFNWRDKHAFGATIGLVAYNHARATDLEDTSTVEGSFAGFLRYRHWLHEWTSVDVSLGAAANGGIVEVALQFNDMFALTAGAHTIPVDDKHGMAANLGIRVGGYLLGALVDLFVSDN